MPAVRSALASLLSVPLLVPALSVAQTQTHSAGIQSPVLSAPWTSSVTLPRFDPDLGHLTAVQINLNGRVSGTLGVENTATFAQTTGTYVGAYLDVAGLRVNPAYEDFFPLGLAAYDGTLDYGGTSGITATFQGATGTGAPYLTRWIYGPYALGTFRGPAGAPGTITFQVDASQFLSTIPQMSTSAQVSVAGMLEIVYHYETSPVVICTGDMFSGWGLCPCGEISPLIRGCPNSAHANGAFLQGSGAASLANDAFVLTATDMTGSTALFLQGDDITGGVVFLGDGKRCIDGTLLRLGSSAIVGGSASYPQAGQLPISVRGQVAQPGTRNYQVYYRNSAAFCTPATFNLTSGVAVWWAP